VLFDISEFGLYNIDSQLRLLEGTEEIEIVPLLSSIRHKPLLVKVLRHYKVDVIYHAAAYKHVPLVEHNIIAGVRNNVFGTLSVAKAAIEAKVKDFVMISTDKAVRPTNVMGATKRLAELMIQGLAMEPGVTTFCAVRFGNVLGSSGSVVPLFRRQIEGGGPVTVTHPEVSRYFMTIPEAAQLVIQAGALARSGDIFVLDMGDMVKIVDLAAKMIRLMGYEVKDDDNPLGSIEIQFTGLRPGEKLREELMIGENLSGTEHSKILRAREMRLEWDEIEQISEELHRACDNFDNEKIRAILLHSIVGYRPDHEFVDAILNESTESDIAEFDTNIAKFPGRL
jgi:FlaA1/EpsC-like NDP-sugar epimerase